MEINRTNINEIVTKAALRPDKDYGQNFLVEPEVSKRIVDALNLDPKDTVLEVGPGLGSLTHFIAESNVKCDAVDIDARMVNFLRVVYQENSGINIVENDIRKQDVSKYSKIIGNLPYNITTETIQYLLINADNAKKMIFMIQSETLSHFYDVKGKEYGPTSVLIHLLGNIKKLFTVKAGSFYPAPKCSSSVFEINLDGSKDRKEVIGVFNLAKKLFLNRRKTIQNNMLSVMNDKVAIGEMFNKLGISPLSRPEELSPETYLAIYRYLLTKQ